MANPIIQQYLQDSSIPFDKRQNAAKKLDSGEWNEAQVIQGLNEKYGAKYGGIAIPAKKQPIFSPTAQDVGSKIGRFFEKQAPEMEKAMKQEKQMGILERLGAVGGQAIGGIGNVVGGIANLGVGVGRQAWDLPGNIANAMQGKPQNNPGGNQAMSGLNQVLGGTFQTLSSPLAVSPTLQKGFSLPVEAIRDNVDETLGGMGIDTKSESGKNILDSFMNAGFLALGAKGEIGRAGKIESMGGTPSPYKGMSVKGALDYVKKTPEMAKEIPGMAARVPGIAMKSAIDTARGAGTGIVNAAKGVGNKIIENVKKEKTPEQLQASNQLYLEREMRKAGIHELDINMLKNLSKDDRAIAAQYFEQASKKRSNPMNEKGVWYEPSREIRDFRAKAKAQLNTIGENMQNAIDTDLAGKSVDATPVVKAFDATLKKMNVTRDAKGNLNFDSSDIALNAEAQKAITTIQKTIKANRSMNGNLNDLMQGTKIDARGLVSINRILNDAMGITKKSGYNANALSEALSPIKSAVDETVAPHSSLYTQAKAEYAALKGHLDKIDNAGKYGSGKNTGFSGKQILTRSMNQASEKYIAAAEAIKKIEQDFGIEAPKNLEIKANLADMAERYTGTQASRTLAKQLQQNTGKQVVQNVATGAIEKGVNTVPLVGPMAVELAKGGKNYFTDINYKYFEGKIAGLQDTFANANPSHVQAILEYVKDQKFNDLPPAVKVTILKQAAPSVPPQILNKIVNIKPISEERKKSAFNKNNGLTYIAQK